MFNMSVVIVARAPCYWFRMTMFARLPNYHVNK